MRLLWKNVTDYEADEDAFKILDDRHPVNWNTLAEGSKISFCIRAFRHTTAVDKDCYIYLLPTYQEAVDCIGADPEEPLDGDGRVAARVMAYASMDTFPGAGTPASVLLTNVADVDPDLTGIALYFSGSGYEGAAWDGIWEFTSNIAELVERYVEQILEEYAGSGKALHGFTALKIKQGPNAVARDRLIKVFSGDLDLVESENGMFNWEVPLIIQVGISHPNGLTARNDARKYSSAVASIIGDQRRTLDGLVLDTRVTRIAEPVKAEGNQSLTYQVAELECVCNMHGDMWSDR